MLLSLGASPTQEREPSTLVAAGVEPRVYNAVARTLLEASGRQATFLPSQAVLKLEPVAVLAHRVRLHLLENGPPSLLPEVSDAIKKHLRQQLPDAAAEASPQEQSGAVDPDAPPPYTPLERITLYPQVALAPEASGQLEDHGGPSVEAVGVRVLGGGIRREANALVSASILQIAMADSRVQADVRRVMMDAIAKEPTKFVDSSASKALVVAEQHRGQTTPGGSRSSMLAGGPITVGRLITSGPLTLQMDSAVAMDGRYGKSILALAHADAVQQRHDEKKAKEEKRKLALGYTLGNKMDAERAREEQDEEAALQGKGAVERTGASRGGYREQRKFDPSKYGMVRNLPRHSPPTIPVDDRRAGGPSALHPSAPPTARQDHASLDQPPSRASASGIPDGRDVPHSQASRARDVAERAEPAAGEQGRQLFEEAVEGDAKADMQLSGLVKSSVEAAVRDADAAVNEDERASDARHGGPQGVPAGRGSEDPSDARRGVSEATQDKLDRVARELWESDVSKMALGGNAPDLAGPPRPRSVDDAATGSTAGMPAYSDASGHARPARSIEPGERQPSGIASVGEPEAGAPPPPPRSQPPRERASNDSHAPVGVYDPGMDEAALSGSEPSSRQQGSAGQYNDDDEEDSPMRGMEEQLARRTMHRADDSRSSASSSSRQRAPRGPDPGRSTLADNADMLQLEVPSYQRSGMPSPAADPSSRRFLPEEGVASGYADRPGGAQPPHVDPRTDRGGSYMHEEERRAAYEQASRRGDIEGIIAAASRAGGAGAGALSGSGAQSAEDREAELARLDELMEREGGME